MFHVEKLRKALLRPLTQCLKPNPQKHTSLEGMMALFVSRKRNNCPRIARCVSLRDRV